MIKFRRVKLRVYEVNVESDSISRIAFNKSVTKLPLIPMAKHLTSMFT